MTERDDLIAELDITITRLEHELGFYKKLLAFVRDNIHDEEAVMRGLQILQDAGIAIRSRVMVYVLIDFDTTLEQDLYRVNKLKHTKFDGQNGKGGTNAYVMQYQQIDQSFKPPLCNPHVRHMARWSNNKWLFWSHDFEDYESGNWMALNKRNQEGLNRWQKTD